MRKIYLLAVLGLLVPVGSALAQSAVAPPPTGPIPQQYDPRIIGPQVEAQAAVLAFREAQLRAAAQDEMKLRQKHQDDLNALDKAWRAEFDGWCAHRPACGVTPEVVAEAKRQEAEEKKTETTKQ
jgi:hypothetical protein